MLPLLLPDWFNPWGWAGLSILVILICIAIIVVIILSSRKKAAKEREEDGITDEAETKDAAKKAAPVKDGAEKEDNEKKSAEQSETKKSGGTKTYHISKRRDDNKWQVKAAGGEKALKLFNTQAEAIEYAKKVAGNQEANIMVHKEDGSFRKLKY